MRWRILKQIKRKNFRERQREIIQSLFFNRGLRGKKQQQEFLKPKDPDKFSPKEVGISPVQLIKALKRIKSAIKNKEKVIIYGDYDTDGVCATAIMWETLDELGVEAMPFIPKREEGYGLKVERIDQMAKEGIKLIITVDQGIVQNRQVDHARKLGIDVIITDHHLPGEIKPKALAIIHTTQFAGAGVAWFLANWLLKHLRGGQKHLGGGVGLDLVTLGTVADVVPLVGPNRSLVKFGIDKLRKTKRVGLLSLFDLAGIDKNNIRTYEIGFIIGPRINAAGRMDDPMDSLRLICTKDEKRAIDLAQKIDQKNRERQALTEKSTLHAKALWLKQDGKSALIFVDHDSYPEGIVGLIASRLMEEFYRPAIIVARGKEWSRASARSIEEFNIIEAIRACADIIGPHGGHPRAAGFSVETAKLSLIRERLIDSAEKSLDKEKLIPTLKIEVEINLDDVNFELYKKIEEFEPFGMGNPRPIFASRGAEIAEARLVGNGNQHLKLRLTSRPSSLTLGAIGFGLGNLYSQLSPEKPADIVYELSLDQWNDQKKLQLKLKDLRVEKESD